VVAVDDADATVPGVPIAIEAQDLFPPVLQVALTDPDVIAGQLAPLNAGDFTLRIHTLCGVPGAETTISGRVTAPMPETPEPRFPGQLTNAGP
jgi:hypothetical protein